MCLRVSAPVRGRQRMAKKALKILLVTPAPPRTRYGNRVTALRWANLLRQLGHRASLATQYTGQQADVLIALHAHRSFSSVQDFRADHPHRPIVVALTGTDLYRDLPDSEDAQQSLRLADRLVALQPKAVEVLPASVREKMVTIYQSAPPLPKNVKKTARTFDVCVVAHLRDEKEPFLASQAAAGLAQTSQIRVVHAGRAMNESMAAAVKVEQERNARYRWLGELPPWRVRRVMAASQAMVLSSKMEGGANVISEAAVGHLPVLASRIPGSEGLLGDDYLGFFPPGDSEALSELMRRIEAEPGFLKGLQASMGEIAPLFQPQAEAKSWKDLLAAF